MMQTPMLPDETVKQLQDMISSGMTPDDAIRMVTAQVDPSKFGGKKQPPMGALPQQAPPQQQAGGQPMGQNDMAQYLQNKVAEIRSRMNGGQMGALSMMPPRR
jgi:hypothetical protein